MTKICPVMSRMVPEVPKVYNRPRFLDVACQGSRCAWWRPDMTDTHNELNRGRCGILPGGPDQTTGGWFRNPVAPRGGPTP